MLSHLRARFDRPSKDYFRPSLGNVLERQRQEPLGLLIRQSRCVICGTVPRSFEVACAFRYAQQSSGLSLGPDQIIQGQPKLPLEFGEIGQHDA